MFVDFTAAFKINSSKFYYIVAIAGYLTMQ